MLSVRNTLTKQSEPFQPLTPGVVKMYVCGPTVYNRAHLGHAMSAIVFDVVRRYLQHLGFRVIHVMNFTDIDDKIIQRANERNEDAMALAQRYIDEWFEHVRALNLLPAHHYVRVSEVMPEIVAFIRRLVETSYAYEADGDVLFRVRAFAGYGKLSGRAVDDALSGARIAVDGRKADPLDFALWKAAKPGEPAWDSPWGPGRPGWHIECSAMVHKFLGEQIDIHGGGNDLVFPHHENEIAQSEAFTGRAPFARYWLHNGMLQLRGEKMSKSGGNSVTIEEFLTDHAADVLRLVVLSSHYRRPLSFDEDIVGSAEQMHRRLLDALAPPRGSDAAGAAATELAGHAAAAGEAFHRAMADDFNTANALGHAFTLVRAINAARDAGAGGAPFAAAVLTLERLLRLLGLDLAAPRLEADAEPFVRLLVNLRADLRAQKQWALADGVRQQLLELGVALEDGPGGTTWHRAHR
jgi:cysteinyl-tRNA synthetase